jgi:ABC-type lipoprotein release transport system permease subunit
MSPITLIFKELIHRKVNAILSLLAITIAVSGSIIFHTAFTGSLQRTKRIQRDMGQNLRIVSKDTDLAHFWDEGFSRETFPENWVKSFTNITDTINYSHLSAVLKWKVQWRDTPAMIYGLAPREVAPPGRKKPIMITPVKRGTVQLGRTLADIHGVKRDATVTVEGGKFEVARVLSEKGSGAEIRIYMHLADAQAVLKREGQINEIQALDCYCADETQDTLALLRKQLAPILPEAKVFRMQDMAEAREQQRRLMESQLGHEMPKVLVDATDKQGRNLAGVFGKLLPLVILVCGVLIAALAMLNTRARSQEIGVLRALGQGGERIALLFLGRAIVIGVLGALLGFAIGNGFAIQFGRELFQLTAAQLAWENQNLAWALLLAPTFAALASFIPAMLAVTQDPADTLRHDG